MVLVVSSGVVLAHAAGSAKMTGYISDAMCGAKHAGTGGACAKKCIEGGSDPVYVDAASKKVFKIENPEAVKGFYGAKVEITASANEDKSSVHVNSIVEAK